MIIDDLAAQILKHRRLYEKGVPEISDPEFDALEDQLRALDPDHPILHFVGTDLGDSKVEHLTPMLSLAKTYDLQELRSWAQHHIVCGMHKVDGSSLSLVYKDSGFHVAKTRGNGRLGENVSNKVLFIPDIPKNIREDIEVRGELFCRADSFAQLVEEFRRRGLEEPSSPRNIVAGILGRKDHIDLAKYLSFFAFDCLVEPSPDTEIDKLRRLEKYGFKLPEYALCNSLEDIDRFLRNTQEFMQDGIYQVDGAVFTYNQTQLHRDLGNTSHHPRYKLSFKWQGQTGISQIQRIEWFTSRNGFVTPVAVIEPIELSGAQIQNVTLHNAAFVKALLINRGDRIEIVRSGEVIPKFLRIIKKSSDHGAWLNHCPSCNHDLEFDGVRLKCKNVNDCPAQTQGRLLNWIKSLEIDDLSEKRLEKLSHKVSSIADLYHLTIEDLLQIEGVKEKMATKLFANIQKSKKTSLSRFLLGLGIEGMGLSSWEKLLDHYPTLENIRSLSLDDIVCIDGFALKSASILREGIHKNKNLIDELLKLGFEFNTKNPSQVSSLLKDKEFVITGTLSRPRKDIEAIIQLHGGSVGSSIKKSTFALLTNDSHSSSTKAKKALELGTTIISEDTLYEWINRGSL